MKLYRILTAGTHRYSPAMTLAEARNQILPDRECWQEHSREDGADWVTIAALPSE